jgi:hypothetical protein
MMPRLSVRVLSVRRHVAARDAGNEADRDAALRLLGGEQLGARRFGRTPQPTEQVQFPEYVRTQPVVFDLVVAKARHAAGEHVITALGLGAAGRNVDGRELVGPGHAEHRAKLLDPSRRDTEVLVLLERNTNQFL